MTKSNVFRTPIWPIHTHTDSSPRPFLSASRRYSRSAISAVGPQVDWQWATLTQVPGSSNQRVRNGEFHYTTIFFKTGFNLMTRCTTDLRAANHTAVRVYRGRTQRTGRRGCHIFLSVSTAVGYAIATRSLHMASFSLGFHTVAVV